MPSLRFLLPAALALAALAVGACRDQGSGPVVLSAIGNAPELLNPNLRSLDPPASFLLQSAAQGLVRFDATGQVEPALAQSWIVSDDGLRYTFRLTRVSWSDGRPVTADQVAERLRASFSRASRNPLKPVLGAIAEIEAMTDDVLEISLHAPRPNFLQLLAAPEMAILRGGRGTGPYLASRAGDAIALRLPEDEDSIPAGGGAPQIVLRGEDAAHAVARFVAGEADAVLGGTLGDLPIAAAAEPRGNALRFDPVAGLFGLVPARDDGLVADPLVRRALSMAIDREAITAAIGVPDLQPRATLVPLGVAELPAPAEPDWAASPLPLRRTLAAQVIAAQEEERPRVRIEMPDGFGYRVLFAHIRRDWRAIGVDVERVAPGNAADLRLIDRVAPASLASWYVRAFRCGEVPVCQPEADAMMDAARTTQDMNERAGLLAAADRALTDASLFIPITAPVRWSLVSPRLTGFQPNPFAIRAAGSLIANQP